MSRMLAGLFSMLLLLVLWSPAVASAQSPDAQATPISPGAAAIDARLPSALQSAGDYCLMTDGILIERFPFAGIGMGEALRLDGSRWFCEYTGSPEAEPPSSRISISLTTLYSETPTLATLAYLVRPSIPDTVDTPDLATWYCAYLGGSSDFGGNSGGGGGWASDPANPEATVIGICVFPDGSAIDNWGLAYHAQGVIRGANLAPLIRYQPGVIPDYVFPR